MYVYACMYGWMDGWLVGWREGGGKEGGRREGGKEGRRDATFGQLALPGGVVVVVTVPHKYMVPAGLT